MDTDTLAHDAPVVLGPELTITQAAASRDLLVDALCATSGDLALDLSGLTDIDSAGIQLLLALRRSVAARGGTLHLQRPSAEVRAALTVLGLDERLQDAPPGADR